MQINPFLRIQNNKNETITKRTTVSLIKPLTCARGENTAHHLIEYLGKMCKSVLEIWYAKDRAESEKNRHLRKTEDQTIQFFLLVIFVLGLFCFEATKAFWEYPLVSSLSKNIALKLENRLDYVDVFFFAVMFIICVGLSDVFIFPSSLSISLEE